MNANETANNDAQDFEAIGDATYCPEDNKLRFYSYSRFGNDIKERVKEAGFRWAPKQECWVAPAWTPAREDLLIELCGEIGDEDYSPEERAADRAERFEGYRGKRLEEAGEHADNFEAGPKTFGHQSAARAERQARRHDRLRGKAINQWSKAEYWQERTAAVIGHALYKSSPEVRRGRILTLEAEQRKHQKKIDEARKKYELWGKIRDEQDIEKATRWAEALSGSSYGWSNYPHPRNPERRDSIWSLIRHDADPINGHEAAALYFQYQPSEPGSEGTRSHRWAKHYELRLAYEKAMIGDEGGLASEVEMIPGGFIRGEQIHKVNKSPATGRVVSVAVMGLVGKRNAWDSELVPGLVTVNIERMGSNIGYRPPTAEELQAFKDAKKAKPKGPSLINPTIEDAQRLQAILNRNAAESYAKRTTYNGQAAPEPQEIETMTQAKWTQWSRSDVYTINEFYGVKIRRYHRYLSTSADSIVVLTDKPQKPLPIDWASLEQPAEERFTLSAQ